MLPPLQEAQNELVHSARDISILKAENKRLRDAAQIFSDFGDFTNIRSGRGWEQVLLAREILNAANEAQDDDT